MDCLPNAGFPKKAPYGVALSNGVPVIQGPDDPAPDYYVSMTSLHLGPADKQRSYVDSSRIPYLAMPGGKAWRGLVDSMGMHLGDVGTVISKSTGTTVNFILADQGNSLEGKNASLAEGSIELANKLGVPSSPRGGGTSSSNFVYVLFPGSGTGKPLSVDEINERADARVAAWGGAAKLKACQANLLPSQ